MSLVLALDQGTTSSRALAFDAGGEIRGMAQEEFDQHYPRPGWVEHDASEIWRMQARLVDAALATAGARGEQIAAVGIANQRETTLIWDRKTGEPIHHAIVWQDRRTAPTCDRIRADGAHDLILQRTGLILDAYFSATKIAWLLDHVSGARTRAERGELAFGTMDSWLAWQLTDSDLHITDVTNACRTLLYNIHTQQWDQELLDLFRIPRPLLPQVRSSSEIYGEITSIPSLRGVPLAGIAGDQQAATFGQVCFTPGMAKCTYGTGCFMLLNTGVQARSSSHQLLTTVGWQLGGQDRDIVHALEGSVFVGGAIVQWLRDGLGIIKSSTEVESLAASVGDSGGVFLVPALAGLGAPHWDPYARGTILGLTAGSTAGHIARAALEGIAFQVADLAQAMNADAVTPLSQLRVDGGAAANDLLMQFQADLLQVPVLRPQTQETTALGAAYLAGLASGYWHTLDELSSQWQVSRIYEPGISPTMAAALRSRWSEAVDRSRRWATPE
ncbi:MAG: glycerol kinase GlpK [Gemmatimonadetes bacterium]|jgi:glycerol kinase|nr:glycerol kinase GlpK [Gemmatimonadota bacterium]MBT5142948.1 glycerol kinase GlpK [Gemmatimonadota bacterium]MBT5589542.1 glycerol kinase GlpK [Gemmatimonadota bacterium]